LAGSTEAEDSPTMHEGDGNKLFDEVRAVLKGTTGASS
jgi:hypothetical protein